MTASAIYLFSLTNIPLIAFSNLPPLGKGDSPLRGEVDTA